MKNQKGPACRPASQKLQRGEQAGETIIEALLALTIVTVIITGVVTAIVAALNGSDSNKNQNAALNYAQEAIEILRDAKSSDFDKFRYDYDMADYYCLGNDNIPDPELTNCPDEIPNVGSENLFSRKVYVDLTGHSPDGILKCGSGVYVSSLVSWADGKCKAATNCHKIEIDSCFNDLNTLPAP